MEKNNDATKTDFLIQRIKQNENFQTIDINEWAFEKIKGSKENIEILELCCGTGKQTGFLLKTFPNANISCLDISEESILTVKENYSSEKNRMNFHNDDIDSFLKKNKKIKNVIFCSYGLNYPKDFNFFN